MSYTIIAEEGIELRYVSLDQALASAYARSRIHNSPCHVRNSGRVIATVIAMRQTHETQGALALDDARRLTSYQDAD